jgi:hypothetical protein
MICCEWIPRGLTGDWRNISGTCAVISHTADYDITLTGLREFAEKKFRNGKTGLATFVWAAMCGRLEVWWAMEA